MAYRLAPDTFTQITTTAGLPAVGYTLESYIYNTSTPTAMYTDSSGTSLGTSCTLNSRGAPQTGGGTEVSIFLDTSVSAGYKFILKDAGGATVRTYAGPVFGISSSVTDLSGLTSANVSHTPFGGTATTEKSFLDNLTISDVVSSGVNRTGSGNAATYLQALIYAQRFTGGAATDVTTLRNIYIPAGKYRCTSPLYIPGNTRIIGMGGQFVEIDFIGCSGFVGFNHATRGDTTHQYYTGTGDQYFVIENLWLKGDNTAGKYGLDFDELYFGYTNNCLITHFAAGAYWKGQVGGMFQTRFSDWNTVGIDVNGQSMSFVQCAAEKPTTFASTAVRIGNAAKAYDISFSGIHIEDVDRGIDAVDCDGVGIVGFRHSNGTTAAATSGFRLQAGSASCAAMSFYNVTSQIVNTHNTAKNVTAYNYIPEWHYGNNASTGLWADIFTKLYITNASSAQLVMGTVANAGLGTLQVDDSNGRLKIYGLNGVYLAQTGDLNVGAGLVKMASGTGTPEAAVTAPVGSIYFRTDGGAGACLYIKESGTGNTGWVAK